MSHSDELSPHRLFAAIVLMGTGLVVGCGGVAEGQRHGDETGGTGHGGGNAVGSSGASASSSTGGSVSSSTGGSVSSSTGGSATGIVLSTGGAEPNPMPVTPGPFACPPQQWSCAGEYKCGYGTQGVALQEGCDCDPTRPLQASDCDAGQVFTCLNATSTADGRSLTEPVSMSCACVPKSMYVCSTACKAYDIRRQVQCNTSEDELSAWCGCAIPFLK